MSVSTTPVVLYSQNATPNFMSDFAPLPVPTTEGGGESFTPAESARLTAVQFRLARTSDVVGSAVCQIYVAAATGFPGLVIGGDGPIAQSDTVDLSTVPNVSTAPTGALLSFSFPSSPTLQGGVVYVAVLVASFTGTSLDQFGCNTNCDPVNNGVQLVGPGGAIGSTWASLASIDYNMIVLGAIPTGGTVTLTVVTVFGDGTAAVPVKVTVSNGPSNIQTKTSAFGPGGNVLTFTVPVGFGYRISLDYVDCAGFEQIVVSPLFDILSNTCITTGGGPFPGPGVTCQTLPNFFLPKPSPPPGAQAELVKRGAFPDFHHFSLSKDGPVDTIFALMGNDGTSPVCAIVQFTFTLPDGSIQNFFGVVTFVSNLALVTDYPVIQPGVERQVAFSFTPTLLGRYTVMVAVLWDVALPIPRFQSAIKQISFDVVA